MYQVYQWPISHVKRLDEIQMIQQKKKKKKADCRIRNCLIRKKIYVKGSRKV